MWKNVVGWFLFAFGVFYMILYMIATSVTAFDTGDYVKVAGSIVYPLFTLLPMWAGWKLAHRKEKPVKAGEGATGKSSLENRRSEFEPILESIKSKIQLGRTPGAQSQTKFCPKCGRQVDRSMVFCPKCGKGLTS